jgi:membrane-associated phospholipid phosphatase
MRMPIGFLLTLLVLAFAQPARAQFDHKVPFDDSGIWHRNVQQGVEALTVATVIGGSLWFGGESRTGKTFWQSFDSSALGAVGATAGKYIFTRARPSQTDDPTKWFQGKGHYSFPSGEVTLTSSAIAPFVLEYGHEHPAVYALELLPLYDAIARVKTHSHWQTDVLAGYSLGFAAGYVAHQQDNPWFLRAMPHGFAVGIRSQF